MKRGEPSDDIIIQPEATNGYDPDKMLAFVKEYEGLQEKIDDIMRDAKSECEPFRQEMPKLLKAAAEDGFSKKEFKTVLAARRLDYKRAHVADALDLDQRANYQLMGEALAKALGQLADTDLGKAAQQAAAQ